MLSDIINRPITAPVAVMAFLNRVIRKVSEPVRIELEDVIYGDFPEGPLGLLHSVASPDNSARKVFTFWDGREYDAGNAVFVKSVTGNKYSGIEFFPESQKDQATVS